MGCDYYIITLLHIYYNDSDYVEVELDRDRRYYDWPYDEDEDDYDEKVEGYIQYVLTPKTNPITIYNNGSFNKPSSEAKYKSRIEGVIAAYNKGWPDITKVVKVERRRKSI